MEKGRRFFSVKLKIYIFVATTVLVVALGTSLIAYLIRILPLMHVMSLPWSMVISLLNLRL